MSSWLLLRTVPIIVTIVISICCLQIQISNMQKALKMDTKKMIWHYNILATFFIVSAQFQGDCSHTLYVKPTTADTNTATLCQHVQGPCLTLSDYLQTSSYHFPMVSIFFMFTNCAVSLNFLSSSCRESNHGNTSCYHGNK